MKYALIVLCAGLFASPAAHAHATGTSFLHIELPRDGEPGLRWDFALHDLVWSVFIDSNVDGVASPEEVQAARTAIESAVLRQLSVSRGGVPCALAPGGLSLVDRLDEKFVSVELLASCPQPGMLEVGGGLFMQGDSSQRVLLSAQRGDESIEGVLSSREPRWIEPREVSAWAAFAHFVGEGIWHVLIGYDHIAFVLLLLLPAVLRPVGGQWRGADDLVVVARDIVTIVTAFTIAHSTTLALAITGIVHVPTQPIEVAIAASIAVAAAINLIPRLSPARLPLAFGFGLVHGFGFANALSELDPEGAGLVPPLAGFNVGVELAQLAIVALVLPVIYAVRGTRWYAGGVLPLGSCALGAAGVVWLIQRL